MSPSRGNAIGRHSIRLRGYDYSHAGAYFVTIVAQHRSPRFGHVIHGRMVMSEVGLMVHSVIVDSHAWHPRVHIDVFQIMPDHVHAIVILGDVPGTTLTTRDVASHDDGPVGAGPRACPRDATPSPPSRRRVAPSPDRHRPPHDARNPFMAIQCGDRETIQPDDREATRCDVPRTIHRDDRRETPHHETMPRGILDGSAHPGCRGQARGPAPTGSSPCDATSRVVNVVAHDTSSCDATYPIQNTDPRDITLSDVVQRIKSLTTAHYRHAVTTDGWPPFPGRLWQRNYYERIIRDDRALANIRRYISANPRNWIEPRRYP